MTHPGYVTKEEVIADPSKLPVYNSSLEIFNKSRNTWDSFSTIREDDKQNAWEFLETPPRDWLHDKFRIVIHQGASVIYITSEDL